MRTGLVLALAVAVGCADGSASHGTPDTSAVPGPLEEVGPEPGPEAGPEPGPEGGPDPQPQPEPEPALEPEPDVAEAVADLQEPAEGIAEPVGDVAEASDAPPPSGCNEAPRPVVLVHGINGSSANYAKMVERLVADGWPVGWVYAFDAKDPKWGCNVDNASAIRDLAAQAMQETGQPRIDLVAHSMGGISSRYYVKNLGGQDVVNSFLTLGTMHHGLSSPCWAPDFLGVCVWTELCQSGDFIAGLNADPATPGELHWVSMYGTADETVPNESSHLDGAENIAFEGVGHDGPGGLLESEAVWQEVRRVLRYPCW
jgi:triacylglycerol lipase